MGLSNDSIMEILNPGKHKGLRVNANDRTCLKTTSPEAAASAMAAHVFPLT